MKLWMATDTASSQPASPAAAASPSAAAWPFTPEGAPPPPLALPLSGPTSHCTQEHLMLQAEVLSKTGEI